MEWKEFETTFSVKLNQQQKEAVQSTKGPVLLLAVPVLLAETVQSGFGKVHSRQRAKADLAPHDSEAIQRCQSVGRITPGAWVRPARVLEQILDLIGDVAHLMLFGRNRLHSSLHVGQDRSAGQLGFLQVFIILDKNV